MKNWFKKELGDGILAHSICAEIKEIFETEYCTTENLLEIAVFIEQNSNSNLHCEVTAYFSPATIHLAQALDAKPCLKPQPENISLLAGSEVCWKMLFSKENS